VKEAVRGASDWARWWTVTLEVFNELGGGDESRPARGAGDDHRARRSHNVVPPGTAACMLGQAACL